MDARLHIPFVPPLALTTLALALTSVPGGCKRQQTREKAKGHRCPEAQVGWVIKDRPTVYRRAGISTRPSGLEERLTPVLPTELMRWGRACKQEGKLRCSGTAAFRLELDPSGRILGAGALNDCPAARCLARRALETTLRRGLVPSATTVCVYTDLVTRK